MCARLLEHDRQLLDNRSNQPLRVAERFCQCRLTRSRVFAQARVSGRALIMVLALVVWLGGRLELDGGLLERESEGLWSRH